MRLHSFVPVVLGVVLLSGTSVFAQQDEDRARRVMEELREAYLKAYNAHDAEAVLALYAEDADVVFPNGEVVRGHEQIRQELEQTFSEYENVKIAIAPKSARFITRRILLVDGMTEFSDGPPQMPPRTQHAVIFHRGQDDQWRIAAIRLSVPAERRE